VQVHDRVTIAFTLADNLIRVHTNQQVGAVFFSLAENFNVTNMEEIEGTVNVDDNIIGLMIKSMCAIIVLCMNRQGLQWDHDPQKIAQFFSL